MSSAKRTGVEDHVWTQWVCSRAQNSAINVLNVLNVTNNNYNKWKRQKTSLMVIDRVITDATTIHDDRVATSSLTMEVEAVTLCPPLDCLKRWQSDHTGHHLHRFDELSAKSEKWNGKPRLECVNGRHPPSKNPVDVLPWSCRGEGKWLSRCNGGQSHYHEWVASQKIWSVEELETLPAAQSQGRDTVDSLEERGVERGSARRSSLKGRERAELF